MSTTPPTPAREPVLQQLLLDAAVHAARLGAEFVRSRTGDLATLDWQVKSRADFVSEVDLGAETRIAEYLGQRVPEALVLGEELTPGAASADGIVFVVDPLDGTTNFLHGYPEYAVSIGAMVGGELSVGVVLQIPQGTLYSALAGGGAYCDGERISVSATTQPLRALLATGFPFKRADEVEPYLRQLRRVMTQVSGVRRAGSASLDLANVAAGRFDAFWELSLAPWDIAAGILLVREAGGRVSDVTGAEIQPAHTSVVASNGVMHEWLLGELR
ncbi:MAG: inositol monophosphatase [Gemmatimonadaceae bacterium]|nr:inositol monophosphatase [Gemmatimonadaceae bacterium]